MNFCLLQHVTYQNTRRSARSTTNLQHSALTQNVFYKKQSIYFYSKNPVLDTRMMMGRYLIKILGKQTWTWKPNALQVQARILHQSWDLLVQGEVITTHYTTCAP